MPGDRTEVRNPGGSGSRESLRTCPDQETLTHLDGDRTRPATLFAQAARLAAIFDRVPRLKRRARRVRREETADGRRPTNHD
ncbi:hypothetical protein F9278_44100 [Streptomyces phaeolivaceus]|uniref:Uncharacterized protein n=1 Tax=Streptomyces phaeolivaceus TaxID=2653200 RepID=A0A5P8KGW8_9ACTN|nr:hypothetical protein F9278_44100 [Streptomyces phaeolivaceus]